MTDRPADARAFSRSAPKAREKRPGDEVAYRLQARTNSKERMLFHV